MARTSPFGLLGRPVEYDVSWLGALSSFLEEERNGAATGAWYSFEIFVHDMAHGYVLKAAGYPVDMRHWKRTQFYRNLSNKLDKLPVDVANLNEAQTVAVTARVLRRAGCTRYAVHKNATRFAMYGINNLTQPQFEYLMRKDPALVATVTEQVWELCVQQGYVLPNTR